MTPLLLQTSLLAAIPAASAASTSLLSAIWQGMLLAAVVSLCLRVMPALGAAARSLIWTAAFLLAVLLHFAPHASSVRSSSPSLHVAPAWSLALTSLWLLLSLARATQLFVSVLALRRLARTAIPVQIQSAEIRTSRRYLLCTSPYVDRPSVIGFLRPRILLPPTLLATLSPAELRQVLLHETEHLRRRDDWTNLLQKLALVLFPLNPALLWMERRLCLERELACDDRVLRATGAPRAYATCLASLAEHTLLRRGVSLALGILGVSAGIRNPPQSELSRRVYRILSAPKRSLHPRRTAAVTAALLFTLSAGALKLSRAPQLIAFTPAQPALTAQSAPATFTPGSAPARAILAAYKVPLPVSRSVPHASQPHRNEWIPSQPLTRSIRQPIHRKPHGNPLVPVRDIPAERSAPSLLLTRATNSQASFTYLPAVAIVTPDGWLIIQL